MGIWLNQLNPFPINIKLNFFSVLFYLLNWVDWIYRVASKSYFCVRIEFSSKVKSIKVKHGIASTLDETWTVKIRTNLTLRTKNWVTKIVLNSKFDCTLFMFCNVTIHGFWFYSISLPFVFIFVSLTTLKGKVFVIQKIFVTKVKIRTFMEYFCSWKFMNHCVVYKPNHS